MDPLSDILTQLRFSGLLYFATEFTAPWGIRVPQHPGTIRFHLVTRGGCFLRVAGEAEARKLGVGDFALVPQGQAHDIAHAADARPVALESVLEEAGYAGQGSLVYGLSDRGEEARLLCGHFTYEQVAGSMGLFSQLPPLLVVSRLESETQAWLAATLSILEAEEGNPQPGQDAILRRIAEILFVQALRRWSLSEGIPSGVLRALANPYLARALTALHRAPAERWTVERLAREAGLSRSLFAERFHALCGVPPLRYLTDWRLQRARLALLSGERSVDEVARDAGYRSIASFSRLYARHFGEGPGATRRAGLDSQRSAA